MAREAERLLAGTRWVPEPLRTPDVQPVETAPEGDGESLPAFLADDGGDGETAADPEEPQPFAEAAE
jgi:ParB family chromosome partitioning protein